MIASGAVRPNDLLHVWSTGWMIARHIQQSHEEVSPTRGTGRMALRCL